jgi:hypothetical protein
MTAATKNAQAEEAREQLRAMLPPGSTVKTILRHVSRSGMTRAISPVVDGEDVSWLVVRAVPGFRFNQRHDGITMGGCGMDMGFSLVYTLSRALYPNGFECIGEGDPDTWGSRCPSNDHSNGDRDYTPHHHSSGGYALKQAWL